MPQRNALIWLWLSLLLIALDVGTKQLALAHLEPHVPLPVVEGMWNWTLTFNAGAAFSFLSDASGWQRWLFAALAFGISLLLTYWMHRTARDDWRQALPYALVIAGAVGNLIDRLRFGHVVDFIQWYWRGYYWPAFNLADSCIVVGAAILILFGFTTKGRK
jgi:signal peptidase II